MKRLSMLLTVLLLSGGLLAVTQKVTVVPGWNAVWIGVTPEVDADTLFADWPTDAISVSRTSDSTPQGQFRFSVSEETVPDAGFLVWHRDRSEGSSLQSLIGDSVLLFKASLDKGELSRVLTVDGVPVCRRMQFAGGDTADYFGVSPEKPVTVGSYLSGLGGMPAEVYKISGMGPQAGMMLLTDSALVSAGQVLVFATKKPLMRSGPFTLMPRYGVAFGETVSVGNVVLRNESESELKVQMRHVGADGVGAPALTLRYRTPDISPTEAWPLLPAEKTLTVPPKSRLVCQLGLERSVLGDSGKTLHDTLLFTDLGITKHQDMLDISAKDLATSPNGWPEGIWVLQATLDRVTRIQSASPDTPPTEASAPQKVRYPMPVRLLMRVDKNRNMWLVQHLTLAATQDVSQMLSAAVYGPGAQPDPTATILARLSSPVQPTDVPKVLLTGTFAEGASGEWTLKADSPSNPFRHPYHPDHDGLDFDFKKPGADKPAFFGELWPIGNKITLSWDRKDGWNPTETLNGQLTWSMSGLRAGGEVTVSGPFRMQRIVQVPVYKEK